MQSQVSVAYFFFLKAILRWRWRVTQNCLHFPNLISLWKARDEKDWERPGIEADSFPGHFLSLQKGKWSMYPSWVLHVYCCVYKAMYRIHTTRKSYPCMSWIFSGFSVNPGFWTFLYIERSALYSCPERLQEKNLTRQAYSGLWETSFLAQVTWPCEKSLDQTEAEYKPLLKG